MASLCKIFRLLEIILVFLNSHRYTNCSLLSRLKNNYEYKQLTSYAYVPNDYNRKRLKNRYRYAKIPIQSSLVAQQSDTTGTDTEEYYFLEVWPTAPPIHFTTQTFELPPWFPTRTYVSREKKTFRSHFPPTRTPFYRGNMKNVLREGWIHPIKDYDLYKYTFENGKYYPDSFLKRVSLSLSFMPINEQLAFTVKWNPNMTVLRNYFGTTFVERKFYNAIVSIVNGSFIRTLKTGELVVYTEPQPKSYINWNFGRTPIKYQTFQTRLTLATEPLNIRKTRTLNYYNARRQGSRTTEGWDHKTKDFDVNKYTFKDGGFYPTGFLYHVDDVLSNKPIGETARFSVRWNPHMTVLSKYFGTTVIEREFFNKIVAHGGTRGTKRVYGNVILYTMKQPVTTPATSTELTTTTIEQTISATQQKTTITTTEDPTTITTETTRIMHDIPPDVKPSAATTEKITTKSFASSEKTNGKTAINTTSAETKQEKTDEIDRTTTDYGLYTDDETTKTSTSTAKNIEETTIKTTMQTSKNNDVTTTSEKTNGKTDTNTTSAESKQETSTKLPETTTDEKTEETTFEKSAETTTNGKTSIKTSIIETTQEKRDGINETTYDYGLYTDDETTTDVLYFDTSTSTSNDATTSEKLNTTTEPKHWSSCYQCGLDEELLPISANCYNLFENTDYTKKRELKKHKIHCHYSEVAGEEGKTVYGPDYVGGCFKRFLDIGVIYNERGCRTWPPTLGSTYASKRLARVEMLLEGKKDGCAVSPHASLTPFARGISLYARYHVCVCRTRYCNTAQSRQSHNTCVLFALSFSCISISKI